MRHGEVKYEFAVQPGADPAAIAPSLVGTETVPGTVSLLTSELGISLVVGLGAIVDILILAMEVGLLVVPAYAGHRREEEAPSRWPGVGCSEDSRGR
jgi:hypothetical protein